MPCKRYHPSDRKKKPKVNIKHLNLTGVYMACGKILTKEQKLQNRSSYHISGVSCIACKKTQAYKVELAALQGLAELFGYDPLLD